MTSTPILIVDDEPAVLEGLREFLEDEGYEVHEAMGARDGLDLFAAVNPDLVMTDLRMPGMSGIDLIGEIRKVSRSVPIIVFTGYGSFSNAVDAIRLDVFDFITKPIDLDYLKHTLDQARGMVHTTQEIQSEMSVLQEQIALLQSEWKGQLEKLAELEPVVQTGRLLSSILHNLSSPLSYIMGEAALLRARHPEVRNLGAIQEQAFRMQGIITAAMKRVKALQTRESEWVQLNDLLREEVLFLETDWYFMVNIAQEWDLDPDLPLIRGTAAQLSRVFENILSNAAEAMKGRSGNRLVIRTWGDASGVYVSIRDTGTGIPERVRERIFEPFFSTKAPDVSNVRGLGKGIGLYHCREVVRQYGGRIEVQSEPEKGATFIVYLPVAKRY